MQHPAPIQALLESFVALRVRLAHEPVADGELDPFFAAAASAQEFMQAAPAPDRAGLARTLRYGIDELVRIGRVHGTLSVDAIRRLEHDKIDRCCPELLPHPRYRFTQDWFAKNEGAWRARMARFAGRERLRFLEIGSFEGRSACWLLDNVLTREDSLITCIDTWSNDLSWLEGVFDANVERSGAAHRVIKIKGDSHAILPMQPRDSFDFVYVDGSHTIRDVLIDGVLSWQLLTVGGLITFDDYDLVDVDRSLDATTPGVAIDGLLSILDAAGESFTVVDRSNQITIEKTRGA